MSDALGSIWDAFSDLVADAIDVIGSVVEALWKEIIAPIFEEIMNWLGFEDQTIVNGFVVVNRTMTETWQHPYKQAVISKVTNDTEYRDEFLNVFLTGYQQRIKHYMNYGENTYYYGLPTASFEILTVKESTVKSIIEAEEGYTIVIKNLTLSSANEDFHVRQWMQDNLVGASPYRYTGGFDYITVVATGVIHYIEDIVWDATSMKYDVDTYYYTTYSYGIETAVNTLVSVTDDYDMQFTVSTASFDPLTPASTYSMDAVSDPQVGIVDTAVHRETPTISGVSTGIVTTAIVDAIPTVPAGTGWDHGQVFQTFQDMIDPMPAAGRGYEVTYVPVSDQTTGALRYWSYTLYSGDVTNPSLYDTGPSVGTDIAKIVPVVPLKINNVFQEAGHGITPTTKYTTAKTILKKVNMEQADLIKGLKDTVLAENTEIKDAFLVFGVDMSIAGSSVTNKYLYEFVNQTIVGVGGTWAEYLLIKADLDDINGGTSSQDNMLDKYIGNGWETREIPAYVTAWMDYYGSGPNFDAWSDYYDEQRAELVVRVQKEINSIYGASKVQMFVKEDAYNVSFSFQAITSTVQTGVIAAVGEYTSLRSATNYTLTLRKQINGSQYNEIVVYLVQAATILDLPGNEVHLSKLDFVGSDNGGTNVKDNMLMPMSWGIMKNEFNAIELKQLVYETMHLNIFGIQVTKLRYYETQAFQDFFKIVVSIVAIVYIAYTGDVTGAEFLWALAVNFVSAIAIEYVITQIVLANPNSKVAIAVATAFAIAAAAYTGQGVETAIDTALLSINAMSQVSTIYVDVKSDILQDEASDFLKTSQEKEEELADKFDGLQEHQDYVDSVKRIIINKFEASDDFYRRTLQVQPSEEMLDLDRLLALDLFFDAPIVNTTTQDS